MIQAVEYIKKELGIEIAVSPINTRTIKRLPSFLTSIYRFYICYIYEQPVIFARYESENIMPPSNYAKHEKMIKQEWGYPVIFVFDHIQSYNRGRLCEQRINYIVSGSLIYLPELFTILYSKKAKQQQPTHLSSTPLPPTAQTILIYYLYSKENNFTYQQLQNSLNMPYPTVSRAIELLSDAKLCDTIGTRVKQVHFDENKEKLFNKAIKLIKSPIRGIVYAQTIPSRAYKSGVSALADYTMINPDTYEHVAVSIDVFKKEVTAYSTADSFCPVHIEVWNYNPGLFADNDGIVDKISLYLSMKDNVDERVQYQLNKMIENIW